MSRKAPARRARPGGARSGGPWRARGSALISTIAVGVDPKAMILDDANPSGSELRGSRFVSNPGLHPEELGPSIRGHREDLVRQSFDDFGATKHIEDVGADGQVR